MELDFLNLFSVLLAAWLAGWLASRLGYPAVLGELVAGVILGPPLLGLLYGSEALFVLADLGVLLMMLYIGMEIDPRELKRASWEGILAAVGGFFTPFALAYLVVVGFGGSNLVALVAGISAGVTSLAVNSRILLDLRILDTRVSHVMMAGALVADILSLLVFSLVLGIAEIGSLELTKMLLMTLKAGAFFAVTVLVGTKLFPLIGRLLTNAGLTGRTFNFTLVLILAVLFGELAEMAGLHAILGAFMAGLFLRESVLGQTLSRDLRNAVKDTSIGLLTPIFFVTAGFEVSFGVFQDQLGLFLAVFGVALFGKAFGTALFYLPSGRGWRESLVIGAGMNGRGGVDIILIGIALESGIIQIDVFSILVFMALLTTATVPLMMKYGIRWLDRRGALERSGLERTGIIIVGAGPLARWLARALIRSNTLTLVDTNEKHCMVSKSEGLTAVLGNALHEQVLAEAHAGDARVLIAMTRNVEVNTLVAQTARHVFEIPEVHILQAGAGLGELAEIRRHLRADALFARAVDLEEWDYRISHGKTARRLVTIEEKENALEFAARPHDTGACLVLALQRAGEWLPLHDRTELAPGDQVLLLCSEPNASQHDQFDRLVAECPVLDLRKINSAEDFFDLAAETLANRLGTKRESLASSFLEAEEGSSTVIAPGLAIPHIRLLDEHPFQLIIARSRRGIHFPNQDEAVHAIFVLASSPGDRNLHLRALSAIAQVVQDKTFEQRWMAAQDEAAIRTLILTADRRRVPEDGRMASQAPDGGVF